MAFTRGSVFLFSKVSCICLINFLLAIWTDTEECLSMWLIQAYEPVLTLETIRRVAHQYDQELRQFCGSAVICSRRRATEPLTLALELEESHA